MQLTDINGEDKHPKTKHFLDQPWDEIFGCQRLTLTLNIMKNYYEICFSPTCRARMLLELLDLFVFFGGSTFLTNLIPLLR